MVDTRVYELTEQLLDFYGSPFRVCVCVGAWNAATRLVVFLVQIGSPSSSLPTYSPRLCVPHTYIHFKGEKTIYILWYIYIYFFSTLKQGGLSVGVSCSDQSIEFSIGRCATTISTSCLGWASSFCKASLFLGAGHRSDAANFDRGRKQIIQMACLCTIRRWIIRNKMTHTEVGFYKYIYRHIARRWARVESWRKERGKEKRFTEMEMVCRRGAKKKKKCLCHIEILQAVPQLIWQFRYYIGWSGNTIRSAPAP